MEQRMLAEREMILAQGLLPDYGLPGVMPAPNSGITGAPPMAMPSGEFADLDLQR